jgi:hypothetical protein
MSLGTIDVDVAKLVRLPQGADLRGVSLVDRGTPGEIGVRLFVESPYHDGPLRATIDGQATLQSLRSANEPPTV